MLMKSESPAASGKAHRAKFETASFLSKEYSGYAETATSHLQIALIRSKFGTTDHLASTVAALAFAGGAA